jgi:1-deoxy-D-xylulose-5-phosphate reductoisomerase
MAQRRVVILGSTGSIGVQALEIIAANPRQFKVVGISAGSGNLELLLKQAEEFGVPIVGTTATREEAQRFALSTDVEIIDGENASTQIASLDCDIVLNGITGSIGLAPTLAALTAGRTVALANKESLVAGGDLVMAYGADRIIPVDSEHSALYQCMLAGKKSEIAKVILTASGGPFRERTDLSNISVDEALAHPTWSMGPVVTINSATLMNKGLEIIEAHYLFDIPYSQIEAVIHPQSVVHSMVEFVDGSTIAQASPPNMKGPIAYALGYPQRIAAATAPIDWSASHTWTFSPIDETRFPAIALAKHCGELGGGATAIFNAANEVAVEAFLGKRISFTSIFDIVEKSVNSLAQGDLTLRDFDDVSRLEKDARAVAHQLLQESA